MAKSEAEVKNLLRVKGESQKADLKLNIQKIKIMVSSSIISWQIEGGNVETMTEFIFLGSKITVDGNCIHEIKKRLLLGRKAVTNLESVLKSKKVIEREQDGRGVGGHGVHLSPQIYQVYTFRRRSACSTSTENRQEYLTTGKEYTEPLKTR